MAELGYERYGAQGGDAPDLMIDDLREFFRKLR
jgi:hypothetical protein